MRLVCKSLFVSVFDLSGSLSGTWGWENEQLLVGPIRVPQKGHLYCALPFLGRGPVIIQCILQDSASPESSGSPDPKRPAASEVASGSQERLDFNRNLQEGRIRVWSEVRSGLVSYLVHPHPALNLPTF